MRHSRSLHVREIRKINELLEQIAQLGTDPAAWRLHMLHQLCEMAGARVGISLDLQGALPGKLIQSIEPVDVGFTDAERRLFVGHMTSDERLIDPGAVAILDKHEHCRFYTLRRQDMVEDPKWYSSPLVSEGRRSANIDHFLISSAKCTQPGWLTGFALYRNWNEKPFDERDRRMMRLFHAGLLRRLRTQVLGDNASGNPLPHYLKPLLRSLLQGHDSKECANSLGLSANTIKTYTKQIYARLAVGTRGQLMAKCLTGPSGKPIFLPSAFDSAF
jgi:hypothetical protein